MPLRQPSFLGELRRLVVLQMLDAPTLKWARSDTLGRTGSGKVWQLADRAQHSAPEMVSLSRFLAGAVHAELQVKRPGALPDVDLTTTQVFPVRMKGSRDDPPEQHTHRDRAMGRTPSVTTIYYPDVQHAEGGDLVLFDEWKLETGRIEPVADLLVAINGNTLHAVEPLVGGVRTSVVVNFYPSP